MAGEIFDRLPPSNLDAERAVLGACILDRDALVDVIEFLDSDDFYDLNYRDVFSVIAEMVKNNQPVDMLTLCNELERRGLLEKLGGQAFLASIVDSLPTAANAEYHARIVREKALHRRLISAGNAIVRMGYDESKDLNELLEDAERLVFEVSRQRNESSFKLVADLMKDTFEKLEEAFNSENNGITGITSGFSGIDRLTSGLQRGALNIIAARPSMGKTALALNIARNVAVKAGLPVLVFSLEMGAEQLVLRLLGAEARMNLQDLINGTFAQGDWRTLTKAASTLSKAPIYIDDSSLLTTIEMKARSRRFKAKHGDIGLIVVDYLQLMSASRALDNKQNEVAEISRGLKAIARELDVPVIALSQLSRAVESRNEKTPQLSDLRDSGAIEQDADLVGLLYRDSYYAKDPEAQKDNSASLDIAKNRNGPTDKVRLVFLREYTRFEDMSFGRE
ncbi:MAG: replicative DNA helicase [Pyramidobacter sp.]|nr:replicative DNA helicase [Pyramidobacter sp.]